MEGDLFGLLEVVRRIGRERHGSDDLHRSQLLGNELRWIEKVDFFEHFIFGIGEDLEAKIPLRVGAAFDSVREIREWTPSLGFQWNLTREV